MNIDFLQIEPTNLCNLNCVMCTRRNLKRHGSMSLRGLKHIIEQIPGVKAVRLQGLGEPMLNAEIIPMIQYLRGRRIRVYTAINGTILPEKTDEFIASVNRVDYSIDTTDPDEFMIIRGTNRVQEIIENFKRICSLRKKRPKTQININCTLLQTNLKRIEELFKLARKTCADGINFYPVQTWTMKNNEKKNTKSDVNLSIITDNIIRMSRKWRIRVNIHRHVCGYSKCKWAARGSYITWDGFVTPCCQRPDPDEINFGNVFESDFAVIYNIARYEEFRSKLNDGFAPKECTSCSLYKQEKVKYTPALITAI